MILLYLLQLFGLILTSSYAFPFSSGSRELKWDYDDVMSGLGRKLRTLSHPKSCSNFNLNFLKTMMSLAFLKTCKDFSSFYRTLQESLLQISDCNKTRAEVIRCMSMKDLAWGPVEAMRELLYLLVVSDFSYFPFFPLQIA